MKIKASTKLDLAPFKEKVLSKFTEDALPKILEFAVKYEQSLLSDCLVDSFKKTKVIRALQGEYSGDKNNDIPAILGLTDHEATSAADEILRIVENTITSESIRGRSEKGTFTKIGNAHSLTFNISFTKMVEQIKSLNNSYTSSGGYNIPWMEWLLDGNGYVPEYRIAFEADLIELKHGNEASAQRSLAENSRSGRALMLQHFGSDWDINDYKWSASQKNFIVEATSRNEWKECFRKRLEDALRTVSHIGTWIIK